MKKTTAHDEMAAAAEHVQMAKERVTKSLIAGQPDKQDIEELRQQALELTAIIENLSYKVR